MFKKDVKYHYGIKKHICGTAYEHDCWVLDLDYQPLKYIYKPSAEFICNELQKRSKDSKYYVVRCD